MALRKVARDIRVSSTEMRASRGLAPLKLALNDRWNAAGRLIREWEGFYSRWGSFQTFALWSGLDFAFVKQNRQLTTAIGHVQLARDGQRITYTSGPISQIAHYHIHNHYQAAGVPTTASSGSIPNPFQSDSKHEPYFLFQQPLRRTEPTIKQTVQKGEPSSRLPSEGNLNGNVATSQSSKLRLTVLRVVPSSSTLVFNQNTYPIVERVSPIVAGFASKDSSRIGSYVQPRLAVGRGWTARGLVLKITQPTNRSLITVSMENLLIKSSSYSRIKDSDFQRNPTAGAGEFQSQSPSSSLIANGDVAVLRNDLRPLSTDQVTNSRYEARVSRGRSEVAQESLERTTLIANRRVADMLTSVKPISTNSPRNSQLELIAARSRSEVSQDSVEREFSPVHVRRAPAVPLAVPELNTSVKKVDSGLGRYNPDKSEPAMQSWTAVDLQRLTDHVMQSLDQRIVSYRERMGRA
jgi:hypothetical protein